MFAGTDNTVVKWLLGKPPIEGNDLIHIVSAIHEVLGMNENVTFWEPSQYNASFLASAIETWPIELPLRSDVFTTDSTMFVVSDNLREGVLSL